MPTTPLPILGNYPLLGAGANAPGYGEGAFTPNANLSLSGLPRNMADNLQIIDALLAGAVSGSVLPVIQASLQAINTTAPQTITITAAATTMYAVSVSMSALGTGAAGHTLTANIVYTVANGAGVQTVSLILPLNTPNVVLETYPLLALAGTPITLTTVYGGGATADPYTISARLVEMPSNT